MPLLATKPDFQKSFQTEMSAFDERRTRWTHYFLVEDEIRKGTRRDQEAIMFIDVGGGTGREGLALKRRCFVNQYVCSESARYNSAKQMCELDTITFGLWWRILRWWISERMGYEAT